MRCIHDARRYRNGIAVGFCLLSCVCAAPGYGASDDAAQSTAAKVVLVHGILAFEEGDYQRAAKLLEEAAARDPQDGTALHWLGLTYLKLGRAKDAEAQLAASLNARRPPWAGKDRVNADLELARSLAQEDEPRIPDIELPQERPPLRDPLALRRWSAQGGISLGGDSNPGLLPETVTGLPLAGGPPAAASDTIGQLDLRLDLVPFYDRGGWSSGASLVGGRSFHQEFDDLDLTSLAGNFSLAWGGDPSRFLSGPLGSVSVPPGANRVSFVLQGGAFDLRLGGEPYLRVVEGGATFFVRQSARTATRFDVAVRDRSFQQDGSEPFRRSGDEVALGLSQSLQHRRANVRLGLVAGERGGGKAFASSFRGALAELSLVLSEPWTVLLSGVWRDESFAHPESRLGAPGANRDDTFWSIAGASIRRMNDRLRWNAGGSYSRNDSNLEGGAGAPLFDYRRITVSTGFTWVVR
jgi:hypothetical protein